MVGDNKSVTSNLLLATSNNTHVLGVPATIDLAQMPKPNDKAYFNTGYVPVAVALEGNFDSDFANRILPKEVQLNKPAKFKSNYTRQIFVACGDMKLNCWEHVQKQFSGTSLIRRRNRTPASTP